MKVEKKEMASASMRCFQSRKLFSILDFHESSRQYKDLKKHIEKCDICGKKILELKKIHQSLDILIPCIRADKTTQESYENEIYEIMKNLMRKYNEKKSFNIKRLMSFLSSFLISKNILIFYVVFTILGLVVNGF